jgi:hypothetical protein
LIPADEYARRLAARVQRAQRYERLHIRCGNLSLLVVAIMLLMGWMAFRQHLFLAWWLLVPAVAYLVLATWHTNLLYARDCAQAAARVYERGLARIEDRWAGTGQTGDRFVDPHHVYQADLDLFGRGSLFELLSTARTRMGEETLASWLLKPATLDAIRRRHSAIAELRDRLDLREDLAVIEDTVRVGVNPEPLQKWAEAPPLLTRTWVRGMALALALLAIAGVVFWSVYGTLTPLLLVLIVEFGLVFHFRHEVDAATRGAEHAFADLSLLAEVLARIEREELASSMLRQLQQELRSHETPASEAIARLRRLVAAAEQGHNAIVQLFNIPLLYMLQVAYAIEAWRCKHGDSVRRWIASLGELEALVSLASYSYEHPEDPVPEFVEHPPLFVAEELGHPLIPSARCVRNGVELSREGPVLLVSGSNMSGKSTLLRAIGINTVLAMAGAPVRARRLRLSPLHVGASIRVSDSLQEGSSRFYAEISRLRQIVDLSSAISLLFLVDEFLQGTNSRDRRIGADALLRKLISAGAIGLVTTHDLALTEIGANNGKLRNVHLQDYLEDGRIRFDYKLREGVVARSNGLELMRSIGLEV